MENKNSKRNKTVQRSESVARSSADVSAADVALFDRVSGLIKESHARVAASVNAEMTELYWQVGHAINENLLGAGALSMGLRLSSL